MPRNSFVKFDIGKLGVILEEAIGGEQISINNYKLDL